MKATLPALLFKEVNPRHTLVSLILRTLLEKVKGKTTIDAIDLWFDSCNELAFLTLRSTL